MTDISGKWQNQYGSVMVLATNPQTGIVYGNYSSSTGSTGTYAVFGWSNPSPSAGLGTATGLVIFWRSIVAGPSDPSWHWVSGLGGQIVADNVGNTMILNHFMVATDDFPQVADVGTYIDKLTYQRISSSEAPPVRALPQANAQLADPIAGQWVCDQDPSIQLYLQIADQQYGTVVGSFSGSFGSYELVGFTDTYAPGQITLQGLTVAALFQGGGVQVLSGWLDYSTGMITLNGMYSQGTPQGSTYVETKLGNTLTFHQS